MSAEVRQRNQVRTVVCDLPRVRVPAAEFRAADDGIRAVEQLRARFDAAHETVAITAYAIKRWRDTGNLHVLSVRGGKEQGATWIQCVAVVCPCVQGEIRVLENVEGVTE